MESLNNQEQKPDEENAEVETPFVVPDLDPEEEARLAVFLGKVQKACADDKSVPQFVGLQVDDWLKEINDKQDAPVTADAIASNQEEVQKWFT